MEISNGKNSNSSNLILVLLLLIIFIFGDNEGSNLFFNTGRKHKNYNGHKRRSCNCPGGKC
jgi:hypothetical protein